MYKTVNLPTEVENHFESASRLANNAKRHEWRKLIKNVMVSNS